MADSNDGSAPGDGAAAPVAVVADAVATVAAAAGARPVIAYSREMGVDHRDFFRILPKAMGDTVHAVDGVTVRGELDGGTVEIVIGPEQVRRIALLAIPYAVVSFRFEGVSPDAQAAFKRRFDLYFQRGGG